jgi:hypothetical protein
MGYHGKKILTRYIPITIVVKIWLALYHNAIIFQ